MAEIAPLNQDGTRSMVPREDRKCIFVQRDYSRGLTVCWTTDFPTELVRVVDERLWVSFIKELNERYSVAEKVTRRSVMETCLGLVTCYLIHPCMKSSYESQLEDIADYFDDVNEQVFNPHGIHVANPMEHGMRCMEVSFLYIQKEKPQLTPTNTLTNNIVPRI